MSILARISDTSSRVVSRLVPSIRISPVARCSDYTAYMYLGELIEFGDTEKIFIKPARKETEDYITGRFG